jgi:hypothetical protein
MRHSFEAEIVHHSFGSWGYTVVWLPERMHSRLEFGPSSRLRVDAWVAGHWIDAAWQPAQGGWYLMLSKGTLKAAGVVLGDRVKVEFEPVDQDRVLVPAELQELLDADEGMKAAWDRLTPGRRRGLAHLVGSAKTADTRLRKLDEVVLVLDGSWDERKRKRLGGPKGGG